MNTKTPVHETLVRLGEQRGQPRYFVNARYLARAGFAPGQFLSIQLGEGCLTVRPTESPTGKRVQSKNDAPLIDLNAQFLRKVFGDTKTLHVRVCQEEITLSIHALSEAPSARPRDGSMGSVFSGAGLLDQAGVECGFRPNWAVEINPATCDTYSQNHPEATVYQMSAHEAAFAELSPVELLLLGLPCQPWSRARVLNADGSKVDRTRPATEHPLGDMGLWAFLIIARCNPRTVVLECAPGFIDGELWAAFSSALRRLGYVVESRVLNAADAGSLSKRKRTVLVAMTPEADGTVACPWPEAAVAGEPRLTAAAILDPNIPEDSPLWWGRAEKSWIFSINEKNKSKGNGYGFQVVRPDSTAIGVLTSEYGETKNDQPVVAHPSKPDTYRFFTLAEGRRLFGLPAHYRLPEAKTVAWRLLGQAVFIPLFVDVIRRATRRVAQLATPAEEAFALSS